MLEHKIILFIFTDGNMFSTDRQTNTQMNINTDEQTDTWTCRHIDRLNDRYKDRQMESETNGQTDKWITGLTEK
jgi:hypothetical protein